MGTGLGGTEGSLSTFFTRRFSHRPCTLLPEAARLGSLSGVSGQLGSREQNKAALS